MIVFNEIKKYPKEISDELIAAVNILKNEGAKKVILFGSLAKKKFRKSPTKMHQLVELIRKVFVKGKQVLKIFCFI